MNPIPTRVSITKLGDIVVDASKLRVNPNLLKKLAPTCASTFQAHFSGLKQTTGVVATLALLPNENDTFNSPSMADAAVTFKAKDSALSSLLTDWHPDLTLPKTTVAYAQLSDIMYLGSSYEGILCIVSSSTVKHRLFLKQPLGEHVWYSDLAMLYCKKATLYMLTSYGYTLSVDFGL